MSYSLNLFFVVLIALFLTACGGGGGGGSDTDTPESNNPDTSEQPETANPDPSPGGSAPDTIPDTFSLPEQVNAEPGEWITSPIVTINGIDTDVSVTLNNLEISINNGDFSGQATTVKNGDQIQVRLRSAALFNEQVQGTIGVDTLSVSFSVRTRAADITPDAFSFAGLTGVEPLAAQTSNSVTISGIEATAPLRVVGLKYSVNNNVFTDQAGTINNGDTLQLRLISSSSYSSPKQGSVFINEQEARFTVTTRAADITPDVFSFTELTDVEPATEQTSSAVNITGIEASAPLQVAGLQYSINGGSFTTQAGVINNGDTLQLRLLSSAGFLEATQGSVFINAQEAQFKVTTRAANTTPNLFSFTELTDVDPATEQTSGIVTISGIEAAAPLRVTGLEYSVNGSDFTTQESTINNGDTLQVRLTSSSDFSTSTQGSVFINDQEAQFKVTTRAANITPDVFAFTELTDVDPTTTQTSNTVTISGIEAAAPIRVAGLEYSVNNGGFTAQAGTINNGDTLLLRLESSDDFSTSTQGSVFINTQETQFKVTTRAIDNTPNTFAFSNKVNAGLSSPQVSNTVTISGVETGMPVAIRATGLEYSINGAAFTTNADNINNGDILQVRLNAPDSYGKTNTGLIQVGTADVTFSVSTYASAPQITDLDLMQGSQFTSGGNLIAESDCSFCDFSLTQYLWSSEGTALSTEDYYQIEPEYLFKPITLKATPINSENEIGSSEEKTYALNRVKHIYSTEEAFAALKMDGSVVTWGAPGYGADSSGVDFSGGVTAVYSTKPDFYGSAFAALKNDGSVVTWGYDKSGGDSSGVDLSGDVKVIYSTTEAFAAIKNDGSVVTWGFVNSGGDSSTVDFSGGVKKIYSTHSAFAALKNDGSVVTWGNRSEGGDSSGVDFSGGVQAIYSTNQAFAAIKNDGSVVTWGNKTRGGDSSEVDFSGGVKTISANAKAFAAIRSDGSVVTWGFDSSGGDSSRVDFSGGVKAIYSNNDSFAAIKNDGSLIIWGLNLSINYGIIPNGIKTIYPYNSAFLVLTNDGSVAYLRVIGGNSLDLNLSGGVQAISSTSAAFAALKNDGSVVTWGDNDFGSDSSAVDFSGGVQAIYSTNQAFAAIKNDGTVVTWGGNGGDSSEITESADITNILSNRDGTAFAAIKNDGSVVTWGDGRYGGDSSDVDFSGGVKAIYSTNRAFAAVKNDGSIVTWGNSQHGGDSSAVDLSDSVKAIYSTNFAFTALKNDGSVVTWGGTGSNSSDADFSGGVLAIASTRSAFAALKNDGSVVTWGPSRGGSDTSGVDFSSGVKAIYSTSFAFAAIKNDGSVVTWGHNAFGGDSSTVNFSGGVKMIYSNQYAFAAIKNDGSIVTWGVHSQGGYSSQVDFSGGVKTIYSTAKAFAAIKNDGSVVTWGDSDEGGNSSSVDFSGGVKAIYSSNSAFAAIKNDGSVVTWGDNDSGADSSAVNFASGVKAIYPTPKGFFAIKNNGEFVRWGSAYIPETSGLMPGGIVELPTPVTEP